VTAVHAARPALADMASLRGEPFVIVSDDSHAGPPPDLHLRPYCSEKYLKDFDEYCATARAYADNGQAGAEHCLVAG
jgi:hypothetical protein